VGVVLAGPQRGFAGHAAEDQQPRIRRGYRRKTAYRGHRSPPSAAENPVLACPLGQVHGLVRPANGIAPRLVGTHLRHAGAEGNQHFLAAGQVNCLGQLALQAGDHLDPFGQRGVGHQDDEFLATVAGQGIARPDVAARHVGQVHQCAVTRIVAEAVIQQFEIVDIEQTDRQRGVLAPHAGDFADQCFVQPLAVEGIGQRVMAGQGAGIVEFLVQLDQLGLGDLDLGLQGAQLLAGMRRFLGHRMGCRNDAVDQSLQFLRRAHLLDLACRFLDLRLEGAARLVHCRQAVDEFGEHAAHFLLRCHRARLGPPLLLQHIAHAALHLVEVAQGQRRRDAGQQAVDLALQPAVVDAQFADVVDQQVQQLEQRIADFELLLDYGAHMVGQHLQGAIHCRHRDRRLFEQEEQFGRRRQRARIVAAERRQKTFDETHQAEGELRWQHFLHHVLHRFAPPGQDKGLQRLGHALPAALHDGPAEVVELGLLRFTARHEGGGQLAERRFGKRRQIGQAGDFVVAGLEIGRSRRQMAHRQALEGFPCNIGRIFRFVHERAGGGSGLLDKQQR